MNVRSLNDVQRSKMQAGLLDSRNYLDLLLKLMAAVGWDQDDPVLHSIVAARASLHAVIQSFPDATPGASVPRWVGARQ